MHCTTVRTLTAVTLHAVTAFQVLCRLLSPRTGKQHSTNADRPQLLSSFVYKPVTGYIGLNIAAFPQTY